MLDDDSEKKILSFWKKGKIFEKLKEKNKKSNLRFSYFDGPPGANGKQHIGHAFNRVLKDIYMRFYALSGHAQRSQPGFDCMGLPVELQVQKELGFNNKEDILNFGLRKFEQECMKAATKYVNDFILDSIRMGMWMNWDQTYYTYDNDYIMTQWSFFKKCHEKKLLYKGLKVVPWCSNCESTCSQLEVSEGYKEISDPSVYAKFKIKGKNEYLLVWTTTPWSLLGNTAVALNPEMDYSLIGHEGEKIWMGAKLIEKIESKLKTKLNPIITKSGKDLVGLEYEFYLGSKNKRKTVPESFVTDDEGTGFVHIAPAHGENDYECGIKHELESICAVNQKGKTDNTELFKNIYFRDASFEIMKDLKEKKLLFLKENIKHQYPHCWRCDNPLVYRTEKEWFLKTGPLKNKFLKEIKKIDWNTPHAKNSAENWYSNLRDWCISRKRYYDGALPFWECENCGELKVVGSYEELSKAKGLEKNYRLFKSYMDKAEFKCIKCSGIMHRVPEVADVWADSAVMPYATMQGKGKEYFNKWFPADFILEAREQIIHWFYTMMYAGVVMEGKSPYKSVVCTGMITDKEGNKLSKSKGNALSLEEAGKKYGIDNLRYYYSKLPTWFNQPFAEELLKTPKNELSILYNSIVYAKTYLELMGYKNLESKKFDDYSKWIKSRLNKTIKIATEKLSTHYHREAIEAIKEFFINDFSRAYIKLIRPKLKKSYAGKDKESTMQTLYEVGLKTLQLMSPFTPFMSEELYASFYKKYEKEASIHLLDWPKANEKEIDEELEKEFSTASGKVETLLNMRAKENIKIRWPLSQAFIKDKLRDSMLEMISFLTNIKEIRIASQPIKGMIGQDQVYLNAKATDELKDEALLSELSRAIQDYRKQKKFNVGDVKKITIKTSNAELIKLIKNNIESLKEATDSKLAIKNEASKQAILNAWNKKYEMGIE
ncbi:MAG: isoleucine--tRNA ligase [Candidatus Nanoarchaeia archaeon]|nr:isoleucine--tRNA ligase [Candidatus Nanoarchaeia archaeon]